MRQEICSREAIRLCEPYLFGILAENPTTLSLKMHTAGFRKHGLSYHYVRFSSLDTKAVVDSVRHLGIKGLSVTIPHKENAFKLVDSLSDLAQKIGAINTVINDGQKLYGENTDVYGIISAFKERFSSLENREAVIIGAGGASLAAIFALRELGVSKINIFNRTISRAKDLEDRFSLDGAFNLEELENIEKIDLLINASPIGSRASNLSDFDLKIPDKAFSKESLVFDMSTDTSPLIMKAESVNLEPICGIRMLIHQAIFQFKLFTGLDVEVSTFEEALGVKSVF